MKETTLLKIALICSLVGLLVLYFISEKIEVKDYKPDILSNKNIGDEVKVSGIIQKINYQQNVAFIEMEQKIPISIVVFADNKNLSLKRGDSVEVIGKLQEYKGKNEIIADGIRVVK